MPNSEARKLTPSRESRFFSIMACKDFSTATDSPPSSSTPFTPSRKSLMSLMTPLPVRGSFG